MGKSTSQRIPPDNFHLNPFHPSAYPIALLPRHFGSRLGFVTKVPAKLLFPGMPVPRKHPQPSGVAMLLMLDPSQAPSAPATHLSQILELLEIHPGPIPMPYVAFLTSVNFLKMMILVEMSFNPAPEYSA